MSKQYLPMLRSMNVTASELRIIKKAKEWVSPELLLAYRKIASKCSDQSFALEELVEEVGLARAVKYIEKQRQLHPKAEPRKILVEYKDYLRMSKVLRVDMSHKSVLFPADILEAHKCITGRYNEVRAEMEKMEGEKLNTAFHEAVTAHYARLGLTGFQKDGLCIVLPQLRTELITEGQSLNHCVGGASYYRQCMEGVYMIFFVRKEDNPGKPYFTMEMDVSTGRIMQLYGFGDCSAPKDVKEFANAFSQFVRNKKARKTA